MRSRLLTLSVAAAAVLAAAPGMAFAQTPAQAEQAAPASIPRWARVSFFANLATTTAADGKTLSGWARKEAPTGQQGASLPQATVHSGVPVAEWAIVVE